MVAHFTSLNTNAERQKNQWRSLVFIDTGIDDYEFLAAGVKEGIEVVLLDRDGDGVEQIATAMQNHAENDRQLDAVHIVSHGSCGRLHLGSGVLSAETLWSDKSVLNRWKTALKPTANILLYGCNVAAGVGTKFVDTLSNILQTNIAASVDLTGSACKGGSWDLNYTTGEIKARVAFQPQAIASYRGILATVTVTNANDSGVGSLRNAISTAQPGDTIAFDSSLANQTITLTSGELLVDKNLTIDGANAAGLTISGNNASRVFYVKEDNNFQPSTFTLRNLIVANGNATGTGVDGAGGGIRTANRTTLIVENSEFRNNVANSEGGGAIYVGFRSNNTIANTIFDGNDATPTNAERGGGAIATKSLSTTTVTDSTFTNNKGINGGAINSLLSELIVENSTFTNNDTTAGSSGTGTFGYGGAIYTDGASDNNDPDSGTVAIRNSRFDSNIGAGQGGGLFLYVYPPDKVIVENSTIINNKVIEDGKGDALGGGLRHGNGELTLTNTTFSNNEALSQGGGLWLGEKTNMTLTNSTFSGNRAESADGSQGLGGAMVINISSGFNANIVNTTIANNVAGFQGGGFWGGGSNTTLTNTIVANNVGVNGFNVKQQTGFEFNDGGGNIQFPAKNPNDPQDVNVTGNVAIADPKLGALQEINGRLVHPLLPGS
ncbi:DUF4347 domain-containing protein, partial [Phormidium sp. CCY1219]|uniref:DUF4347 domain-containing protein n=1 Tax=Phormidium sp. CCY1219 TaxID=2886104 RepID=UPI002D1EC325